MRTDGTSAHKLASPAIPIDRTALAEFCRARGIARIDLFGSVVRDDFTPESDIDVMIDFISPEAKPRGWDYFGLGDEIAQVLCPGRRVDWSERALLRPRIRAHAESEAINVYAAS
jgi:predicted nucleotidyltransferase